MASPTSSAALAPRRRRGPLRSAVGCLVAVVGLVALTSAIRFAWDRWDRFRYPWAYASSGRPTLTGSWVGTLTSGGGVRRAALLDLRLEPRRFGRRSGRRARGARGRRALVGEVRLCGNPAGEQRFTAYGGHEDAAASRFRLALSVADSVPPDGLAPSHLRGRWDGGDSLAFEADLYLRRGASAISGTDDPDTGPPATIHMGRGDEAAFRALCARLARGR
jgi:hypothetical protein